MKIVISSAHGKYIRGASASPQPPYLDEVNEARRVVNRVAELWINAGVGVDVFHDDTSTTQSQNLNTIVNYHNSRSRDYDVSVHFNAYQKTDRPMGCEVLYVTQQQLAHETSLAIAQAGRFTNRGAKKRTDLTFLNATNKPAILLEVCFVDSSRDGDLYRANFEEICRRIAEVVGRVNIGTPPVEPTDPPPEPEVPPPDTGEPAHVDITIAAKGEVVITINGQDIAIEEPGPEDPATPVFQPNHSNIIASVFGGAADPNTSAYPPYDKITDTELSCALPYKWRAVDPPRVLVHNIRTGKDVVCNVRDVGPWLTDDVEYVLGNDRPLAEQSPIPRGPHAGKKGNGAGIDLTPAAAKLIYLTGLEPVDWRIMGDDEIA